MTSKKTAATVATPKPPRKTTSKGAPPASAAGSSVETATNNPTSTDRVALNFSVSPEFRKEWNLLAVTHDLSGVELLRKAKEAFEEKKKGA